MKKKGITTTSGKRDGNNWRDLLSTALAQEPDKVPSEYRTSAQIAEETGRRRRTTLEHLSALLAAGKIERKSFRILTPSGAVKPTPHYRIIRK